MSTQYALIQSTPTPDDDLPLLGDTIDLTWMIQEQSGGSLSAPTSVTVSVLRPDGVTDARAADTGTGAAEGNQQVGAIYTTVVAGAHLATCTVVIEERRRSSVVAFTVITAAQLAQIQQVRLQAADVVNVAASVEPDFTDSEIFTFLNMPEAGGYTRLAAALALETLAADTSRLAAITKKGTRENDERTVYQALMDAAQRLRDTTVVPFSMEPSWPVFTLRSMERW